MAGRPRKRSGKRCGARTRKGTPCQRLLLLKGGKCPNHGGMSLNAEDKRRITLTTGRTFLKTGPKTPEGLARCVAAMLEGLARFRANRRAERAA